jgi:hypothetical protein
MLAGGREVGVTSTENSSSPPPDAGPLTGVQGIAAFAAGKLTIDALLQAVQTQLQTAPDDAWEILSLADQLYRRGRIPPDSHQRIKSCVGAGRRIAEHAADDARPAGASPSAAPVHDVLLRGRYRLGDVLGRGESAVIFAARDTLLTGIEAEGARLAVKVFHPQWIRQSGREHELFRRVERARSLCHPNILRIYDVDRDGDRVFVTMELLTGATLSEALNANPQRFADPARAQELIQLVGAGLAHAHSRGVIHGNLDTDHVFIAADGAVRIMGFGTPPHAPRPAPSYASPGVAAGKPADERDDLAALAGIGSALPAGRSPAATPPDGVAHRKKTGFKQLLALVVVVVLVAMVVVAVGAGLYSNRSKRRAQAPPPVPPGASIAEEPRQVAVKEAVVPPTPPVSSEAPAVVETPPTEAAEPQNVPLPLVRPSPEWARNVRIEFQVSAIDAAADDEVARVVVKRRGSTRGKAGFVWWTESGSAKPGRDYETVNRHQEVIEDGKVTVTLLIPVILGAHRAEPGSFYVMIDEPSQGALLGEKSVAIVTLPASTP